MANHVLFLTHGMGWNLDAGANAWFVEVEQALESAWKQFPSLQTMQLSDFVRFVPISYDKVFRDYLSTTAGAAEKARVEAEVMHVIADADGEEAGFFWTNVMDALLYRFGADLFRQVHVEVMDQIAKEVRSVWANNGGAVQFSMIAHSLGTAVAHGALNRMAGPIGAANPFALGGNFELQTYVALANVSRVLWPDNTSIYDATVMKPPTQAIPKTYVRKFVNVRHVADPFTAPMRFEPTWQAGYALLKPRHLRNANVHAYTHYLANPRVAAIVFRGVLPNGVLTKDEVDAVAGAYLDVNLPKQADRDAVAAVLAAVEHDLDVAYAGRDVATGTIAALGLLLRDVWRNLRRIAAVVDAVG